MTFKIRATKSIALALTSVITITPILNTVSAMDNNTSKIQNEESENYINENLLLGGNSLNTLSEESEENLYENCKNEFKSKFGNSDEFKLIAKTKEYKTEGNGYTGQLRVTTYDSNGNIENVTTIDYLNNIKELELKNIEEEKYENSARAESYVVRSIKTGGIDPFSLSVRTGGSYSSKYKMYATGYYNSNKTWYKNYWKDGYTKGLYDEIIRGRNAVDNIASSLSPGVTKLQILSAFTSYVAPLAAVPTLNTIAGILAAFTLVQPVMTVAGYTLTYLTAVNVAQYNFKKI